MIEQLVQPSLDGQAHLLKMPREVVIPGDEHKFLGIGCP